ncbi:sodium-translocating pyrophosphatase [Candidatus Woesearchaeota archaeon]|nr:sodium-translocating pyrophosphatase [Candidatus Woesearchaeota archaeon]
MLLSLVIGISLLALGFAGYLLHWLLKQDEGSESMKNIADAIKEGANAFVKRQYKTIALFAVVVAVILFGMYYFSGDIATAVNTSIAFLFGALCSSIAGIIGMVVAVRANIRTAAAARKSINKALQISLRAGAISGFAVVALSLLGISVLYLLYGANPQTTPFMIVGFAFGASFVALFAQLGGGIYTKAADVGADLVGKVEAGIPEDDPRNPAVIADLVGDNVGDCAGRGADLFESTAGENIGAMILGVALFPVFGINGVLFPLVVRAFALIASAIGVMVVRTNEGGDPMAALNRGYYVTSILAALSFYAVTMWLLGNVYFFYAGLVGLVTSLLVLYITQYYTEHKYRPVQQIAEASKTGPATNIITGIGVGFECTGAFVVVIAAALFTSYKFGVLSGVAHGGLYGTAMATMGMLSVAAYVLAMDNFGPITDNAGGIAEMSKQSVVVRRKTDRLDAVGNTTKALTKGYAIGSAALAAFLLFAAYLDEVAKLTGKVFNVVDIAKVPVFIGALIGGMLVFLFASMAMLAVGKTASYVIEEVRRQFKKKGIMEGKIKPDYARCVDITTRGALKSMVAPSFLVVIAPVVVGFLLKAEAIAGLLMVATIVGVLLATVLNNAGGAWDNAKKYIESGMYGGKGSDAHKAAVVGDTVGDPCKDTVGPSLHVLIKLLATLTLVLAPLFI